MNNPTRYSMDTLQTSLMIYVIGIVIHGVQCQLSSPVLVRESETASLRWQLPAASVSFTAVYVISPSGALVLLANTLNNYQVTGNYTARVTYTGNLTADPKVMAFDLRNVVRSDAGDYICGRNGLTNIIPQCGQKLVVLGQPAKPSLNGPSAPVFGRQVTLTCSATSTTVPADHSLTLTYTWQRDNTDIIVTSPGSPFTFTVSSRDSHSYRCRARESRGLESDWSQLYNLEPQYGPYAVTLQPSTLSYTRREGQERVPSILCSATCKPACTYKWFKDRTPHSDGATLTLPVADRSQTGSYKCEASNTHGTVDSSSVSVDVTYVPEVTLSPTCQPHRVYVGQPNAQLICQVTAANPSVTSYIWTHNGSPISSATSREYSLSPVSRSSGGSYTCAGRNSVGTSSVSAVTVEVQYKPSVSVPQSTPVRESQTLNISCSVDANTAAAVTWTKKDDNSFTSQPGSTLTISNIQRSQAGTYVCTATNTLSPCVGTALPRSESREMTVDVQYVPEVTLSPTCQPHRVYVGQPNAQLICQVTAANPSVTSYIWTHNGSPISSATSREYSLSPVSRSSGGSYTCAGRNSVGTSSVSAVTVEVQYKPSVSVPQSTPVRESQTLNISCSVDANPAAAVTWTKKDDKSFTSQPGSTLTISNIQRSQAGTYVCTATNTLSPCVGTALPQSESREMTVDVQYVPEVTLSPTCQPHRVYVGQPNAQLICQVTAANPSVTSYIWTHNGSPISSATSREYSLSPVSRSSGGSYTCAGRNSVGTSSVSAVTVEVQYKPSVSVPQSTPVRESQTLNISCSVDANPAAAVTWTKKDDSSFTSQSGSTLTISNIQRSQAGTYVCTATNTLSPCVGTALPQSESREMTVDVQYSANITSFSINSKQNRVTVNERDPVTITCQVDGNPRSSIVLYNGSVEISRADNSESDQKGWPHAECRQRGNYSCTADNNIGSGEQRRVVELLIHCSPRYDESYPVQDRYASATNSDVSLSVHILSYPSPNITWSSTNITTQRNLTSSTSLTRISDLTMMSTLTLTNVQQDDFREYHVYVNNGVGQPVEYSITLDAKGPPSPPKNVTVIPLGPSSLQVSWIKDFNGGDTQTFIVEYSTDDASWKEAGKYVENGLEEYQTNITGLQPQTVYHVRVTAENINGRSFGTNSVQGLTRKEVKATGSSAALIGGAAGGSIAALLLLALVAVLFMRYKRKTTGDDTEKIATNGEKKNMNEDDKLEMRNAIYESADRDEAVTQENVCYASSGDPGLKHSGGASAMSEEYAVVKKTTPQLAPNQSEVYAVIQKEGKEGKKPRGKKDGDKGKKQVKGKEAKKEKGKNKGDKAPLKSKIRGGRKGEEYENTGIGEEGNPYINHAFDHESENVNKETVPEGAKYGRDEDGLLYVGIDFSGQNPSPQVHREEESTEYAGIQFGVVGQLHKDEDEEKKTP